jgi:hypothetical protein
MLSNRNRIANEPGEGRPSIFIIVAGDDFLLGFPAGGGIDSNHPALRAVGLRHLDLRTRVAGNEPEGER